MTTIKPDPPERVSLDDGYIAEVSATGLEVNIRLSDNRSLIVTIDEMGYFHLGGDVNSVKIDGKKVT